ncbi:hypothetical protein DDE18_09955 [Nocardioides gansuensis]|uniref:WD40 repeat domain-containing protein n=1 Tax=Nocardioides gansuensis TaxID=2138300 RepID=A0A2T8FAD3_9ACTN|nr:hypothetical protein [Nocardioides gansuensis]PVG82682.1 hypothetical protein DDE18_09955 [Nocardioides gansuensis]
MSRLLRTLAALVGAVLLAAPALAAAPSVDVQPEQLPRGADIAIAHIEDGVFVDGDRRVDLGAPRAYLLGRSGKAWIVGTTNADGGGRFRIKRLRPDDSFKTLLRGVSPYEVVVSDDGGRLARTTLHTRDKSSVVRVWSARSGRLLADRTFAGYLDVRALAGDQVVLAGDRGTLEWDSTTDWTGRITRRRAWEVDLSLDLMASFTGDPYEDGCTVVSPVTRPRKMLWRSCKERVEAFSPDGERMATVHILSDGIGPVDVWLREVDGTRRAHYTTSWFGSIRWESDTALLLDVNGERKASTVRCVVEVCENATDPGKVPTYRLSAR